MLLLHNKTLMSAVDAGVEAEVDSSGDSFGDAQFRGFFNSSESDFNGTVSLLRNLTTTVTSSVELETYPDDSSIIAKISLLLVVTAVVLIASYKFVVRLFLGYADRKDEVVPDDFSDDEDSAVVKRDICPGDYEEMDHFG